MPVTGKRFADEAKVLAWLSRLQGQVDSIQGVEVEEQVDAVVETDQLVVEEFDDDYTLTSDDFGKILMMNAPAAKTFTLPAVAAEDIGFFMEFVKRGEGKVTIQAGGTDVIDDSTAGGAVLNDFSQAEAPLATIKLWVIAAGVWCIAYQKGDWRTS